MPLCASVQQSVHVSMSLSIPTLAKSHDDCVTLQQACMVVSHPVLLSACMSRVCSLIQECVRINYYAFPSVLLLPVQSSYVKPVACLA